MNNCKKIRHVKKESADKHAEELNIKKKEHYHVYKCSKCGYYHVGHVSRGYIYED